MTRKKTWLCLGAALLILAGTAASGYFWYRDRQSQPVTVTADQAQELPAESVVYFRQKDDRWRADALGDSRYHMADSGCLVCCVASALQMQHLSVEGLPADADAGQVNEFFSAHGVYDSKGNLQWEVLEQVTGLTAEERDAAALDECLQNGDDPIVLVKMPKSGSFHFVLLVGSSDGEYQCMDPLQSEEQTVPLSCFGSRIYGMRVLHA